MRVHHLNCISTCPIGGALMDGRTRSLRARLACHSLLLETDAGLVLVDTGLGLRDCWSPRKRLSKVFLALVSPEFREEMTAIRQIRRMGFDPHDVRNIVLTHLDFDHAGGLDDFPWATVHLLALEQNAAFARPTLIDRMRYRPEQWSTQQHWKVYRSGEGEPWMGFDCVRDLDGLPPEVLLVPLIGHTLGHCGVAFRGGEGRWLLDAGDAYFFHREMDVESPWCTPGLRAYQWMLQKNKWARLWNQQRLRDLKLERGAEVTIFSSHDVVEYERLAGRPLGTPAHLLVPDLEAATPAPLE